MQEEEVKPSFETENDQPLNFTPKTKNLFAEIAKWAKFVGIVGFSVCGILLIVAFAMVFMGDEIAKQLAAAGQSVPMANNTMAVAYAIMGVLYYFPSKYIYDFSVYMKQAIDYNDQESIDYSFDRLRALFKFVGMLAFIAIGFYVFAFLFSFLAGGAA